MRPHEHPTPYQKRNLPIGSSWWISWVCGEVQIGCTGVKLVAAATGMVMTPGVRAERFFKKGTRDI